MLPFSITAVQLLFHPVLKSKVGEILEKLESSKWVEEGIWKKKWWRGETVLRCSVQNLICGFFYGQNISIQKGLFDNKSSGQ